MTSIFVGLKDFWRAHRLLLKEHLWPLFLIPGILSLFYVPLSIVLTFFFLREFTDYVHVHWVPGFLQGAITYLILSIFLWIAGVYFGFLLFRNVIMILYSPILGFLSEATELKAFPDGVTESAPLFSWKELGRSAVRGTSLSLLTLLFAVVGFATSFLIALIPVIGGIVAVVFMPLLSVYLAGVGFCDPPLERREGSVGATLRFSWRNRGRIFGHGLGFTTLLLVPVLGWFLAPSYGVVAGTLGTVEILKREDQSG